MKEMTVTIENPDTAARDRSAASKSQTKLDWETPRMEDVSEQVTAQPYIRFT